MESVELAFGVTTVANTMAKIAAKTMGRADRWSL